MKPEIRKIRQDERAGAVAVLAAWNLAPVAPRPGLPEVEAAGLDPDQTFVAVHEGRVVGVASYVLLGDGVAQTASLAVAPDWRGRGVGERLQHARLADLRLRGVRRVRTETDRPETIEWYVRKFGYRVQGRAPKKHPFSLEDVHEWTVLVLDLA